jgi:hypothetical protein
MFNNSVREQFIAEAFSYYKNLGKMRCAVLENEPIIFGDSGFTHLMRKGRKTRPFSEMRRRMNLLRHVPSIIGSDKTIHTKTISNNSTYGTITYFSLINSIDNIKIKLILRQYGTGNIHFLSIMTI